MNWEAIGAIGEVVGAIGVIATLVYLALQIRQNSNVVRSATRQAVSTAQTEMGLQIAINPELGAATARITSSDTASSITDDAIRDEYLLRAIMRMFENQFYQNKDGTFDDALWAGYREHMKAVFNAPTFPGWWEAHRAIYSTDFAAFVETHFQ